MTRLELIKSSDIFNKTRVLKRMVSKIKWALHYTGSLSSPVPGGLDPTRAYKRYGALHVEATNIQRVSYKKYILNKFK